MNRILIALAGLAMAFSLSQQAFSAEAARDFDGVLAGAKKEGGLVVVISSPSKSETHQALFDAFKKRFGIDIQIEWTPAGAPKTNAKVIAEASGGQGTVDIVGLGSLEDVIDLSSRDLLKPYPWTEVFGKELPGIKAASDLVVPDLKGLTFPLLDAVYVIAWNSQLMKDDEVPTKLMDLADPKWAGKFALNAFFLNPIPSVAYEIGNEATFEFAKKLIANKPVLERGTPAVSRAISTGQVPFGISNYHSSLRAAEQGEPQKFRLPADYIPVFQGFIYVPENAPHPNAARLFLAWLVTEGIKVANTVEPVPLMSDKDSEIAKLIKAQEAETGAKVVMPTSLADAKSQEPLRDQLSDLISGQ